MGPKGSARMVPASAAPQSGWRQQATTPAAGFAKINGTATILSWQTPNDGLLHAFTVAISEVVATTEVGGAVALTYVLNGTTNTTTLFGGAAIAAATAQYPATTVRFPAILCDPNTTVTLAQSTALTVGASTVYAQINGS
jgi:hypothetical protein